MTRANELQTARKVLIVHVGLGVGFGIALILTIMSPGGVVATDFTVFWTGWWLILSGQAPLLYDAGAQRAAQHMLMAGAQFQGGLMAFINPPHVALAGVPFGWLADHAGERAAFLVWTAGSVALLVRLDRWLREAWGETDGPSPWLLTSALVAFYPVFQTLNIGQVSLLLGVAVLGLYRAIDSSQPRSGAAWLLALSIKPQLMPALLVFLVARRCWGVIAYAAAMMLVAGSLTAALLGPLIWVDYAVHLGELEHFWGTGTPAHMRNVRGLLTRLPGFMGQPAIDAVSLGIWVTATLLLAVVFLYFRIHRLQDSRPTYSFAVAAGLLVSPHLFVQDVLIWTVPLVLYAGALRDAGRRWRPFATFALCWPTLFALGHILDLRMGGGPAISVISQIAALVVATAMIGVGTWRLSVAGNGIRTRPSSSLDRTRVVVATDHRDG